MSVDFGRRDQGCGLIVFRGKGLEGVNRWDWGRRAWL